MSCVNHECKPTEKSPSRAHLTTPAEVWRLTPVKTDLPKVDSHLWINSNICRCPFGPFLHQDFDQSIVIFRLDLKPGDVVIESGTGSGVMSSVSTTTGHRLCLYMRTSFGDRL